MTESPLSGEYVYSVRIVSLDYIHRLVARYERRGWPVHWVITRPGGDHPHKWVARCYVLRIVRDPRWPEDPPTRRKMPTRLVIMHDSLPEIRSLLPAGFRRLKRSPADPWAVEETWW